MSITVELDDVVEGALREQIVEAAARQMLHRYVFDDEGDERQVSTELGRKIEVAVLDEIREQTHGAADGLVAKILEEKIVVTDRFGYGAGGSEKSVAEVIAAELKSHIATSRHGSESTLLKMIREEVERQFRDELRATIASAKDPVLQAVREQATKVIEETLAKALPL